jgi:HK97 gp10 family phage protein
MAAAAAAMADLSAPEAAAYALIAAAARRRAPRRTGALAASVGSSGGVTATASYAVPVHWGTFKMRARPFIWDAAESTEPAWTEQYARHADRALDRAAT